MPCSSARCNMQYFTGNAAYSISSYSTAPHCCDEGVGQCTPFRGLNSDLLGHRRQGKARGEHPVTPHKLPGPHSQHGQPWRTRVDVRRTTAGGASDGSVCDMRRSGRDEAPRSVGSSADSPIHPHGRGWIRAVAVLVFVALSVAVVIVIPWLLVSPEDLNKEQLLEARNNIRSTLLQAIAGLAVGSGAIVAWRKLQDEREAGVKQRELEREGQITERLTQRSTSWAARNSRSGSGACSR